VRIRIKERSAFKNEREFLDFARSYLSEIFPNPKRIGCPSDDALRLLAIRPVQSDPSTGEHLTCCSPCFTAYMAHLDRAKAEAIQRQRHHRAVWIRRSATASLVAAILVIVVYVFIGKHRAEPIAVPRIPAPITSPGNTIHPQAAMYVPVVIDLSNASPTRGSKQGTAGSVPQVIPSDSRLDLTLRLPLGSDERLYSIALRSRRHIVWSESTQARRQNGDMLLRLRADFSHLPAGHYDLQVASNGGHKMKVTVLIKDNLPQNTEPKP
jgi:hypothetical protein